MKIGIDARLTYYRTGGISTYTRQLIHALEKIDTENSYVVFHSRKDKQTINQQFHRANLWTPAHHQIERLALSAELLRHQLDVLHSPDFIPPYRGAKKHVITVHDLTFLHYPQYLTADSRRYYNDQIGTACQHADHILAVSEATKHDLIKMLHVPAEKISVQPHGVSARYKPLLNTEITPVRDALSLPEHYILHVGTWEPRKNILGLLTGYKLLLEKIPDAPPVVLVGRPGWLFGSVQKEIEALGINEHLLWRDTVSDEQLPAVYNAAMMLVSPSFYEGFGMPALEAMACGTMPIVSNRSSLPEVVGNVGLLVDPDDPSDIAAALYKGLHEDDWRIAQQAAGIERAQQFTWERSAEIALRAYTTLR